MTCRYLDVLDEVEEIFQTKVAIELELEMNEKGSKWIKKKFITSNFNDIRVQY